MNVHSVARILEKRFDVPVSKIADGDFDVDGNITITERVSVSVGDSYMMAGRERKDGVFSLYPIRNLDAEGFLLISQDIKTLMQKEIEDAQGTA